MAKQFKSALAFRTSLEARLKALAEERRNTRCPLPAR
jgi:hypothetical protein